MFKFMMNNKEWTIEEKDQLSIKRMLTEQSRKNGNKDNTTDAGAFYGVTFSDSHKIVLDKDLCVERKQLTLYHELAHCYIMMYITHLDKTYDEEMVADIVSNSHEIIHKIATDYFSRSEEGMFKKPKKNKGKKN